MLLDIFTFKVFFLHDSDCCWSPVKTGYFVLLAYSPNNSSIWCNWLSFEENGIRSSNKWTIDNETVADYPTDIAHCEVYSALMEVKDILHAVIESNTSASLVSDDTFWLSSGSRSVQDIQFMRARKTFTFRNFPVL